jgi:hypothetical protein
MRKVVLMLAFVMGAAHASAQSKEVTFGLKGGVQFTNYSGDFDDNGGGATGYFVGGLVDFHITPKFHIQPELLYSVEGSKNGGVNYLRVPVLAKFYMSQNFTAHIGPQVAFKVGAADDFTDRVIKSTDIGLGFGLGYEMPVGLMFDARYNLGLANISEVGGADVKNTGIMLGIGYRF